MIINLNAVLVIIILCKDLGKININYTGLLISIKDTSKPKCACK